MANADVTLYKMVKRKREQVTVKWEIVDDDLFMWFLDSKGNEQVHCMAWMDSIDETIYYLDEISSSNSELVSALKSIDV